MTNRRLICIECPKSCVLSVDIEDCRVVKTNGQECPKGEVYAVSEIERPTRILTATVLAEGLPLRMVPVRTDKPIPKAKIMDAALEVKKLKLTQPVEAGGVVVENFLGLGVNLIATRGAS
jgi:CxxC motif-containing protein